MCRLWVLTQGTLVSVCSAPVWDKVTVWAQIIKIWSFLCIFKTANSFTTNSCKRYGIALFKVTVMVQIFIECYTFCTNDIFATELGVLITVAKNLT